ncbi:hypothetical protein SAMN05216238_11147 [Lentibacillus persicus]|uniref:Uncharacterized protein n=1 Tax=Lentibacillus persicus TaxID=640948 RepID=A0A1I1YZW2_9BACI|nr:hypothetical protein [Lentibacillus persicus]SFE25019.1 hypothetical protein SAMN05216238_11147 [Lentibacillus persicus]
MAKKERPDKQTFFNLTGQDRLEFDLEDEPKHKKDEAIDRVFRKLHEKFEETRDKDV